MNDFKSYAITKQLTQVAAALPKFGEKQILLRLQMVISKFR